MLLCKISNRSDYALSIIRIMLGAVFLAHGAQKVFGLWQGPGLAGFVQYTSSLGAPTILGYAAAFFELIGGFLLFFGIAAELGACMIICVMAGAILLAHPHNGFFAQNGGFEYPLVLIAMACAIIIGGPGHYALWSRACHLLGCDCEIMP